MYLDRFNTLKIFFSLVFFIALSNILDFILSLPIKEISSILTLLPLLISRNIFTLALLIVSIIGSVLIETLAFKNPFFL